MLAVVVAPAPRQDRSSGSLRRHGTSLRTSILLGLYCLASLSTPVDGQGGGFIDPRNRICLFDQHRIEVVGSTLFVDGGEWAGNVYFQPENNTARTVVRYQNEDLWKLDLTKSFAARTPPWEVEQKPSNWSEHYNGAEGTIWNVGMGNFVTIGGWFSPRRGSTGELFGLPYTDAKGNTKLPDARMFTYNVSSSEWTSVPLGEGVRRISTASWASSVRKRRGYVLGGLYIMEEWTGLYYPAITGTWLDTMTQYDFVTGKWKSEELPSEIGKTLDGGLIALDQVGEDGVLVFLGGQEQSTTDSQPMRSMETIWIYDIATSLWYSQITTGDIPTGRRQTCFFTVPAPDWSSYQIYLFSGMLGEGVSVLDFYVLTIPGFIWTKVPLTDYPDNYPINSHQCSPHAEGRQMLIVPGNINASDTTEFQWLCNNRTGIRIFDTRDWRFTDEFDPSLTEIGVPKPIVSLIGGTIDGGATVKEPKDGWQHDTLGTIFSTRNQPIIYDDSTSSNSSIRSNDTTSTAPSGPTNSTSAGDSSPELSGGAIAGIAMGVVIAILAFGGFFFFSSCRRLFWKRNGDVDGGNTLPMELAGGYQHPAEVPGVVPGELAGYIPHQELGTGYMPAELVGMNGKIQYPVKPEDNYGGMQYTKSPTVDGGVRDIDPELLGGGSMTNLVGYHNTHDPNAVYTYQDPSQPYRA